MQRNYRVMLASVGALIVVVVVLRLMSHSTENAASSPEVAATTVAVPATSSATSRADKTATVESAMAAFFKKAPISAPAAIPLERFQGNWQAQIVSVDIDGDNAPFRDTTSQKPFAFTIKSAGGEWTLVAADGRGQPRILAATPQGVVAQADGAPELSLSLRGEKIIGVMDVSRPARGRFEFHATKQP